MPARIRLFLLTASGIGLLALGYGLGEWKGDNRTRHSPKSMSPDHLPVRSAMKGLVSAAHPGSGGGGAADGPATAGTDLGGADLSTVLANPHRESRELELRRSGSQDFRSGQDWKSASAAIGDLVDRGFYLRGVIEAWAGQDPGAALDHLEKTGLSTRTDLIPRAIGIWASSDPEGAEDWVRSLEAGEVRDRALEDLFRSWAILDPEKAASRSLVLDEGARYRVLAGVVQEWSANDFAAVREWARNLKDPDLKDFAAMAVADEMAARAPREAMRWASEHLASDAKANPEIVALVASKAGFESPRETFDWLKSVPPSPEAASSLAGVATYLVEDDLSFAWGEFAGLPDDLKNLVGPAVASTLGSRDPDAGLRWLAEQPGGEARNRATGAFVAGWVQRNPAEAEEWVAKLPDGPQKNSAREGLSAANGEAGGGVSPSLP